MGSGFELILASVPDRDSIVVEIWWNDQQVAELRRGEESRLFLDIYPPPSTGPWSFEFLEFLKVLEEAERRLNDGR